MAVKLGYKQTEVGVIPEEWDVMRVCEFGSVITGGTPQTEIQGYWNGGYPWITPTDITDKRDMRASERMISEAGLHSIRQLPANCVLVTCIASIGKNAILRSIGGCNQQINAVVPQQGHSPEYLYYLFESSKQYLLANAGRTATRILSKAAFERMIFPIAPPLQQRAIAAALIEMDALLGGLDRLIAKKRELKQAAMQQLLTGHTRLPGFHGEWDVKRLGDIADFANGKPHEGHMDATGQFYLVTLDSIGIDGKLKAEHKPIGVLDNSLQKDDIVTIHSDIAHGNLLGLCDLIPENSRYVLNQRVGRLRVKPDTQANPQFLRLQINRRQHHFKTRGQGTSQRHVYRRDFDKLELSLPKPAEQTAIAEVLAEMGAELAALEQRREKTRALKQAMMQELLTGRTRLV